MVPSCQRKELLLFTKQSIIDTAFSSTWPNWVMHKRDFVCATFVLSTVYPLRVVLPLKFDFDMERVKLPLEWKVVRDLSAPCSEKRRVKLAVVTV